jgi:predicted transcriptional regulator
MASDILKLTSEIVISHASVTELSPQQLIEEIKEIYQVLTSLEAGVTLSKVVPAEEAGMAKKRPVPLKDIVKEKYVVCLECGKKMRVLKAHLKKAHNLLPKEYFQRFELDPKKYPLVCKEYSAQRRKLAIERGLGARRKGKVA